ncbi:MAG: YceI family protein [Lewinellaceae bacterium]|nr:YceI family protein [Lewinellaceae bacterium]
MSVLRKSASLLLLAVIALAPAVLSAQQRYYTRDAKVYFDATNKNSPERVDATSKSGTLVIDAASGRVESAVLVKGFLFEKALMQEHFNENYMESSKFPKATFKGQITDASKVSFNKDGVYKTEIAGDLSIHGVSKPVKTTATITVKGGKISASTNFNVGLADYGIDIPSLVADKLAKEARLTIDANLEPMK